MTAGRKLGLPPVIARGTRVLILGSFPGEASLAALQYYAHARNHFWPLMGEVLGAALVDMPYRRRLTTLRARAVGLWDVIVACERRGSLDGAIRNAERFNGKTAGRAEAGWRASGYETLVLPSSSPAYTRPFAEKLAAWRAIGDFLR